ncbi:hypothetical protein, variant [Phytophthora nicotianae P10297]|uniref:ZSWIM1/3 RNaseH-like domain-containing protein n=1 Tax=Phytophthora nicotianae P10297 TaxID=1317064 RepID=W2YYD8_PHYNI|nr:hypothetical protein, variant [Phytophthora nicotianae P10297]
MLRICAGRRAGLRDQKPVDYIRAAQGFTKDSNDDDDYVDDPMDTLADAATEDADMQKLVEENDGIAANAAAKVAPANVSTNAAASDPAIVATSVKVAAKDPAKVAPTVNTVAKAAELASTTDLTEEEAEVNQEDVEDADGQEGNESNVADGNTSLARASVARTAAGVPKTNQKRKRSYAQNEETDVDDDDDVRTTSPVSKHAKMSSSAERRLPRRKTKTFEDRAKMLKSHKPIDNFVPELPVKTFHSWDEFHTLLQSYEEDNFLHFRVRSSETRAKHNSRPGAVQIPEHLSHSFKRMRCTHGVMQASRGEGRRDHGWRYTGCDASFTIRSRNAVKNGVARWEVAVELESEISKHNHKTSKTIYDSYRGAKSMPLPSKVREDLGLLTDMKASTADINRYLSDKLDMVLTTQQTRNILQEVLGSTTVERTRVLLDTFVEEDNNDVLRVQDQMGITCVIAMQTSLQKKCFEQWGDSLVMDWTHGTNNLGYHLGSLVVTSATGRGIPIIDFLALDQKFATMKYIVEFFKRHNPSWKSIRTIVIDKDFVEWRVLEKAFPHAKVLLCQFHALTYWRKVCRRPKFNLKMVQQDTMEAAFAKLIYWYGQLN